MIGGAAVTAANNTRQMDGQGVALVLGALGLAVAVIAFIEIRSWLRHRKEQKTGAPR